MKSPLQEDIVAELRECAMSAGELVCAVRSTEQSVREALNTLCLNGRVRRHGFSNGRRRRQLFELCPTANAQENA